MRVVGLLPLWAALTEAPCYPILVAHTRREILAMAINNPCGLLERLLREPAESSWLEFKRDYFDPHEIGQYISALSNGAILNERERAFIVFGIDNGTRKKVGTKLRLKKKKVKGDLLEHWLNNRIQPRILINMEDFMCEDKWFSIIEIEQTYERPVKFDHEEYIRIGEIKRKLSDFPEHERSLWTATGRRKFESAIAKTNVDKDTVLDLLDIKALYSLLQLQQPQNNKEIMRKLEELEFINDNLDGYYDITNLGAVLLAKSVASFPSIERKSVRIIKYAGIDKTITEYEKEGLMGYAAGFPGMINYLVDHLPKQEEQADGIRHTVHEYPVDVVRELVANALIHQDFTVNGVAPLVEVFQNRVEISNPGSSLIRGDRMLDGQRSRNEKLANTMRKFGICEERGSGLDKAIMAIESAGLPAPRLILSEDSVRIVLWGSKRFTKMNKEDKIRACYFHCVIRWLQGNPMSNASLRDRFRLEQAQYQAVSIIIRETIRAGKIIPESASQSKKSARYIPYWAGSDDA